MIIYTKNNIKDVANKVIEKYKDYIYSEPEICKHWCEIKLKTHELITIYNSVAPYIKARRDWLIVLDGEFTNEEMEYLYCCLFDKIDNYTLDIIQKGKIITLYEFLKVEYVL